MIEIYDGWCIETDGKTFSVTRKIPAKTKDGEDYLRTDVCGYYGSLQAALEGLARMMQTKELSERELTLAQAIVAVAESNARLRNAIREALPDVKVVMKA